MLSLLPRRSCTWEPKQRIWPSNPPPIRKQLLLIILFARLPRRLGPAPETGIGRWSLRGCGWGRGALPSARRGVWRPTRRRPRSSAGSQAASGRVRPGGTSGGLGPRGGVERGVAQHSPRWDRGVGSAPRHVRWAGGPPGADVSRGWR